MGKTSIEWTDHSVNPIRLGQGHYCQKISPGCAHCYASRMQPRFGNQEFGGAGSSLPKLAEAVRDDEQGQLWLDESKLREVLSRKKPTRYFWCDMTDLFGAWVPDEFIDRCFAVMALTPQHTHQVLTKRADRMADYFRRGTINATEGGIGVRCKVGTGEPFVKPGALLMADLMATAATGEDCVVSPDSWPLPNVWLGVSVENQQAADERIPLLLQVPAAVRFLSVEPLLGPVDLNAVKVGCGWRALDCACSAPCDHSKVGWVIVGGESGPNARPMHPDWARSLRDQCQAAGVPFFFKQWGAYEPALESSGVLVSSGEATGKHKTLRHNEHSALMNRVGKRAAGRLLDGRTWDEVATHA